MRTRQSRPASLAAAGALAVVLLAGTIGSAVGQSSTVLTMTSQPGDYIGQGQTYSFTPATATFTPSYDGSLARFAVITPGYTEWWYVTIAAPPGHPLLPGTYANAVRAPFRGAGQPGLDVYGDGRGCNTLTGSFTVNQAIYDASNNVLAFDATFEQHCEGFTPALTGHISYQTPLIPRAIGTATASKAGNSSISITVPAAGVSAGDMVVVAVTAGTFAGAVGCADSKGNHYSVDVDLRHSGRLFICSARNVAALAPGDTITATYPGFSGVSAATATEFGGISTVVRSATASGNNAMPSVRIAANAGDLVFGAVAFGATPAFTPGCGFSLAGQAAGGAGSGRTVVDSEWLIAPSTATLSACGVLSQSRPWLAATVVYRP